MPVGGYPLALLALVALALFDFTIVYLRVIAKCMTAMQIVNTLYSGYFE